MLKLIENILRLRLNGHNLRVLCAELVGTCMIVLFGCGSVCSSLSGAYKGIWQVAVIWGLGVSFAIYCTASVSNAHLNPAVSLAFFFWRPEGSFKLECIERTRKFKENTSDITLTLNNPNGNSLDQDNAKYNGGKSNNAKNSNQGARSFIRSYLETYLDLLPSFLMYSLFQVLGAILGGLLNLAIYSSTITSFERKNNITRGDERSILTAKAFGEYFPNPDLSLKYNPKDGVYEQDDVSIAHGLFIEAWGTFILVFVIFVLTNVRNGAVKMKFGSERPEDMKKNMYCVCVEYEEEESKINSDEKGVLLGSEDTAVLRDDSAHEIGNESKSSMCCKELPTSGFKPSKKENSRRISISNICNPIAIDTNQPKAAPTVQSIPSVVIPGLIGFTVAMNLALYAPLTQAGWNPARDFGPRIVAYFAGWGNIAIPGPRGGFWIYILGPFIGGILAGGLSEKIFYGFKH